jgi:type I restriction enzyme, S subunit
MNYTSTMQTKTDESSLPKGWQWVKLGDVCERMTNGTSTTQNTLREGLPVTRIETISSSSIDMNRVGWIDKTPEELENYILKPGDILFSHINSLERLGNCAIYTGQPLLLIHGMNLLRMQVKRDVIDSSYLLHYFRSQMATDYYRQNARKAIGQASLNTKDLNGLPILLPPLDEQQRIASRLNEQLATVESARKAAEEQLHAAYNLPLAYLKDVFESKEAKHWQSTFIGDLAETCSGSTPLRSRSD